VSGRLDTVAIDHHYGIIHARLGCPIPHPRGSQHDYRISGAQWETHDHGGHSQSEEEQGTDTHGETLD
jgi:hypothetical protein